MQSRITLQRFLDRLDGVSSAVLLAAGTLSVLLFGVLDFLTGHESSFSIFYILPIGIVSWRLESREGVFLACLSAIAWLVADIATTPGYSSALIPVWNSLMRLGIFLLVSRTLRAVKHQEQAVARQREGALVAQSMTMLMVQYVGEENNRLKEWLLRRSFVGRQPPPDVELAAERTSAYLTLLSEASFAYPYYQRVGEDALDFIGRIESRLVLARSKALTVADRSGRQP